MNQTENILLDAIKHSLFGTEVQYPNETDWDGVLKEAKYLRDRIASAWRKMRRKNEN